VGLNTKKIPYKIMDNFLKNMKLKTDSTNIKTLLDCDNFYLETERLNFRRQLSKVSGIYMLKCKLDSRLFYIGQSLDLSTRLGSHFNRTELESSKLGNILKYLG
jgi:GIY-YIG catalytic domain